MKNSLFQFLGFLFVMGFAPSHAQAEFYHGDFYDRQKLQGALDNVYVADEMIVRHNYRGAQDQINKAIVTIAQYEDHDLREARRFLFNSIDNLGFDDIRSRDFLNSAESIFENKLQLSINTITRQELQSVLGNIYRSDSYIVDGRYNAARNEINLALNILRRYSEDQEMLRVARKLEDCYFFVGRNDSRARDFLNDGETIVEDRLRNFL